LSSKHEALCSNLSTTKKERKKKGRKERKKEGRKERKKEREIYYTA
jgi:hypothetical protein